MPKIEISVRGVGVVKLLSDLNTAKAAGPDAIKEKIVRKTLRN